MGESSSAKGFGESVVLDIRVDKASTSAPSTSPLILDDMGVCIFGDSESLGFVLLEALSCLCVLDDEDGGEV